MFFHYPDNSYSQLISQTIYSKYFFDMSVRHFFLDKTNTIVKGSYKNTGLNPILELNYGKGVSRGILHFDECQITSLIEDRTYAIPEKLSFRLKMTNCFSVDGVPYEKNLIRGNETNAQRATSFDVMAFKLPKSFDEGRGYDYESDFWMKGRRSLSNHGSSWYYAKDAHLWPVDSDIDYFNELLNVDTETGKLWIMSGTTQIEKDAEGKWIIDSGVTKVRVNLKGGIYSNEFFESEYEKYENGEESIFIGKQHFDFGDENLNIDITSYVLSVLNGEENYGIGLMFSPVYESLKTEKQQYVGFFTDHTNTFFHPYIECVYGETIHDDRENFCIGKENRLYLYVSSDGENINLDEIPTCTINGIEYDVVQQTKGVYYATVFGSKEQFVKGTVEYDVWSNLIVNGNELDEIELEFEVKPIEKFITIGTNKGSFDSVVPSIYGINDNENLNRHEIRTVNVDFRKKYETDKKLLLDGAEYRLYVKDGNREVTVINNTPIEKTFLQNFFNIHTEDLIPNKYYLDISVKNGSEKKYFKNILNFNIVSDVTNRYE